MRTAHLRHTFRSVPLQEMVVFSSGPTRLHGGFATSDRPDLITDSMAERYFRCKRRIRGLPGSLYPRYVSDLRAARTLGSIRWLDKPLHSQDSHVNGTRERAGKLQWRLVRELGIVRRIAVWRGPIS